MQVCWAEETLSLKKYKSYGSNTFDWEVMHLLYGFFGNNFQLHPLIEKGFSGTFFSGFKQMAHKTKACLI